MNFKVLSKYNPEFSKCINCHELGTLKKYRSRGLADRIAKLFFFRMYFCKNCQWRGRYFTMKFTKNWVKTIFFYFLIIGLTIVMVYYYLENFI